MDKKKINPAVETPLVAKSTEKIQLKVKKTEKLPPRQEAWFAS
ncbi:MAG: hypothetical protein WCW44_06420 [archaeon]